jgi:hypothetical protein
MCEPLVDFLANNTSPKTIHYENKDYLPFLLVHVGHLCRMGTRSQQLKNILPSRKWQERSGIEDRFVQYHQNQRGYRSGV